MSILLRKTVLWWENGRGEARYEGGEPHKLTEKPDLGMQYDTIEYDPGLKHWMVMHHAQAMTVMSREEIQLAIRFLQTLV